MASERIPRQIELLLDQIEEAASQLDWHTVRKRAQAVLSCDPENQDTISISFVTASERALGASAAPTLESFNPPQIRQP